MSILIVNVSFVPTQHESKTNICFDMQTTDKAVAVHYGQDTWSGHDLGYVLEFPQDSLNRGALLQWVSQYPGAQCDKCFCEW